jgi:alkylated DNA repair dioxygenase AlkB
LITEYTPGAAIGWHRDAPGFGVVVGISLMSECRFRFRRGATGSWETTELRMLPRAIYVLTGAARSEWQHSIPAVAALRYSITFRTMKAGRNRRGG